MLSTQSIDAQFALIIAIHIKLTSTLGRCQLPSPTNASGSMAGALTFTWTFFRIPTTWVSEVVNGTAQSDPRGMQRQSI